MLRKEFEINMKNRFRCSQKVIENWIDFAEENVSSEQYVNFTPEPDEQAVQRWLDRIFSALYLVQRHIGDKAADEILRLTEQHCLYPHEIIGTIEHLKAGGNMENLIEKSLNGCLDYSGKLPTLDDVKKDLTERHKKQERER